ncbi:MAG: bile acid:sodium symporter [Lentisphaeria bacterium]|nr:bile acid:sodium symporter [Lentisphaeria bacterium]
MVLLGFLAGWFLPAPGKWGYSLNLVYPCTFLVFLLQGMSVDIKALKQIRQCSSAVLIGALASQALAPFLGSLMLPYIHEDFKVGFALICVMGPTLVSGTVIASSAGAEKATCIMITILVNILAVFMIPFTLKYMIGAEVDLNPASLLIKLMLIVLLPAIIGQLICLKKPAIRTDFARGIKFAPIYILGFIIYMSVSKNSDELRDVETTKMLSLILPSLFVHFMCFAAIWYSAKLVKMKWGYKVAVAFVASQKTLPVAVAVWSMAFDKEHTFAVVAIIVFHMVQIYFDGMLAPFVASADEGKIEELTIPEDSIEAEGPNAAEETDAPEDSQD